MACVICGARCKCKKAPRGLCCDCHRHKVRRIWTGYDPTPRLLELGITQEVFEQSVEKHQAEIEAATLAKGPLLPFPEPMP